MKYRLNWKKFTNFMLILLVIALLTWFFISFIEVVLKNTTENITYSNWNLLIRIFGK